MNLRNLEYFIAVAQTMNFHRAAESCGVSQPALSVQLKKLETVLGVQLFERHAQKVILSRAGEELIPKANKILMAVKELKASARDLCDPYQGKLTLGAFPTLSPYLFPCIFNELRKSYPKMKFYLVEEKTNELVERLIEGKLDAAFIALPYEHPLLASELIFKENFLLATNSTHPLSQRSHVDTNELAGESLLLLTEGHCLRDQSLDFCSQHNISEHYDFRASSLETLRQMVSNDIGITLMPQCAVRESDDITYIPFKKTIPNRQIALFWRRHSAKAIICEEIADDLKRMHSKDGGLFRSSQSLPKE
jgi:LysR family transcriptional regulator, hydrogen peroxide-inducible genes activator